MQLINRVRALNVKTKISCRISAIAAMEARHAFQVFAVVSMITVSIGVDPCVDYELVWMEDGRRSSDFSVKDITTSICDAYLNQTTWYRFDHDAGSRLIEKPVEPWYCGSQAPIWLNGTHPTDATEVTAEVCATYSSENICGWNGAVRIRLCNESGNEYFVYLLAVPPNCSLAYCVDADSRKQCIPPLVWHQEEFRCKLEEIATTPTSSAKVTPTCSAKPPSREWSSWGSWSVCSKPCDYGLQSRTRRCGQPPCEGPASNVQLCNRNNCPELHEEKNKGIVLQVQSTDHMRDVMSKVVENQETINTIIRNGINNVCSQSPSLCCGHTIESNSDAPIEYVTSIDLYAAQGYPRPESELIGYYKIVAVVNEEVAKTICSRLALRQRRSRRQLLSTGPYFIPYDVMAMATRSSLSAIEKEAGVNVIKYLNPVPAPDGDAHGDDASCPTATCIVPIVICIVVIPITAVMIGCLCHVVKSFKTKLQPDPGPPAYEYIVESPTCDSPSPLMPFAVAAFVNGDQEKFNELPQKQKAHSSVYI